MGHEAAVDLRNVNTLGALLVELVGSDRRVLQVVGAGADLAPALTARGCHVSGVELGAAGDAGPLDLLRRFGKESFDAVVLGDVLPRLADPAAVLRDVRPLLSPTGCLVASVPNVAHGSVRLALLSGRFEYGPLEMLGSRHRRFFTRESLHALLREAGFVPVDFRRTTVGVFDTEVPVRREDFEQGVVDAVEGDPESTTHHFVVRAVPEDSPEAIASPPAEVVPAAPCRVGIWAVLGPADPVQALVVRVAHAELTRRLPRAAVRVFSAGPHGPGSPHDGGLPVEPLGPGTEERARLLAAELDCAVVVGDLPGFPGAGTAVGGEGDADRFLLEGLGPGTGRDCPVVWSAVHLPEGAHPGGRAGFPDGADVSVVEGGERPRAGDEGAATVPDPLLLVPRLLRPEALGRRLALARALGWFPQREPAIVVEAHSALLPRVAAVAAALDEAAARQGAGVVLVALAGDEGAAGAADALAGALSTPVYHLPPDAVVDDVVAVVSGAAALVACSPPALALGVAYQRPTVWLAGPDEARPDGPAGVTTAPVEELSQLLGAGASRPAAQAVGALQARLDAHYDRLAGVARAAAGHRRPGRGPSRLPPREHVAALELAHRRMRERLDAERRALAGHLDAVDAAVRRAETQLDALRSERDGLLARLREAGARADREAELRRRLDDVTAELEALKSIRLLRLLRPARAVYARLRGGRL